MTAPKHPYGHRSTESHGGRSANYQAIIFDDTSLKRQWKDIEHAVSFSKNFQDEVGWIEGQVHEIHVTQKEIEFFLVPSPSSYTDTESETSSSSSESESRAEPDILRIFISCPNYCLFTLAINQVIKLSLRSARIAKDLPRKDNTAFSLSLIYVSGAAVQSIKRGVLMEDRAIIDLFRVEDKLEEAYYVPPPPENDFEILSMAEVNIGGASTPRADLTSHPSTPGPKQEVLAPDLEVVKVPDGCDCDVFDISSCPPLNTLYDHVGKFVPIFGVVVSIKPPGSSSTGSTYLNMTLSDSSGRFKLTCFQPSTGSTSSPIPSPATSPAKPRTIPPSTPTVAVPTIVTTTATGTSIVASSVVPGAGVGSLPPLQVGDVVLFKSVKIKKWESTDTIIGTVYNHLMEYIVYRAGVGQCQDGADLGEGAGAGTGQIIVPSHAYTRFLSQPHTHTHTHTRTPSQTQTPINRNPFTNPNLQNLDKDKDKDLAAFYRVANTQEDRFLELLGVVFPHLNLQLQLQSQIQVQSHQHTQVQAPVQRKGGVNDGGDGVRDNTHIHNFDTAYSFGDVFPRDDSAATAAAYSTPTPKSRNQSRSRSHTPTPIPAPVPVSTSPLTNRQLPKMGAGLPLRAVYGNRLYTS